MTKNNAALSLLLDRRIVEKDKTEIIPISLSTKQTYKFVLIFNE